MRIPVQSLLATIFILTASAMNAVHADPHGGPFGSGDFGMFPPGLNTDFLPPGLDPDFTPGEPPPIPIPAGDGNDGDNGPPDSVPGPEFCVPVPGADGPPGQAGLSSIAHLDFSETIEPVTDGAWGRMMYRWIAPVFDFVFNGHELPPGDEYVLTYQPQPLHSPGVICLGAGTVNEEGNVHIQDAIDIGTDLPADWDENEDTAVLALVIAGHVDCDDGVMLELEWAPDDYLFGDEGMFFVNSSL